MAMLAAVVLGTFGCSVTAEGYATDEKQGSTHAAIRVRQVETLEGTTRGDVMAGFLNAPATTDPDQLLVLAGLLEPLPAKGDCRSELGETSSAVFADGATAELLDAAAVELITVEGRQALAPHAFPGIADLLRGVVFTSRDRNGAGLPANERYNVEGRSIVLQDGSQTSLSSAHQSPPLPSAVTVNGERLSARTSLSPTNLLEVSWEPLEEDDLISVRIQGDRGELSCTFADAEGYGTLPLVSGSGEEPWGSEFFLSVHRIRQLRETSPQGVDELRMSFDFALEGTVAIAPSTQE